jgi:D-alanyl-D-alanine carboxypeptidase/D-alanyl-D-alanine-endopeptidase (penicillin-binding protein 4)
LCAALSGCAAPPRAVADGRNAPLVRDAPALRSALVPAAARPTASPAPPWSPRERAELQTQLGAIFDDDIFARGGGVAVVDAAGATLFDERATHPLTPASTLKLAIAATALDTLGATYRFETSFVALEPPGPDGTLQGPLWLVGSGDPLLTSNDLREGVAALRRLGVRRIAGPLLVDAGAFSGPEQNPRWDPSDLDEGYAAATSALSLDQGTVEFDVTPGRAGEAADVRIEPPNAAVVVRGGVTTGAVTDVHIERRASPEANVYDVDGTIASGAGQKYWKPVLGVPLYVAGATAALLAARGIALAGRPDSAPAPLVAHTLWMHRSPPLSAIVAEMLVHSNNHSAEQLLRAVGARYGRAGNDAAGIAAERRELDRLGVTPGTLAVYDGSGLAPSDKVPPLLLARLVAAELRGPSGATFLQALPRVGLDGTVVYHELHAALGRARAKSGHLTGVNALAGTVETHRHGRVAFAILVNDPLYEASSVSLAQDRALDALADF